VGAVERRREGCHRDFMVARERYEGLCAANFASNDRNLVILRWLCESLRYFRRLGLGRECP
jgi:hypothetical protein